MSVPTVAQALPAFVRWAQANLATSTVYAYQRYVTQFVVDVGDMPLDQLTPSVVKTWSQRWHPLQAMQRFASWATFEARLISTNPLARLQLPATFGRTRVLSEPQLASLLRASSLPFRQLLLALRETIGRPQELRGVRWHEVRQVGGVEADLSSLPTGQCYIACRTYKGKKRRRTPAAFRVIVISRRLGRLLVRLAQRGVEPGDCIFRNTRGRPWSANAVRCAMRRLRLRVGLGADLSGEKVVAYTLRHTQATLLVRRGVRDRLLAEVMGHTSPRMTQRYVHLVPEDLAGAIRKLERR